MNLVWKIKKFEELTAIELYNIMHLRGEVFIVEQNCPYLDADGKDLESFHLMGISESYELIAYARIVPAGISFKEVSIGRVVSSSKVRGKGVGKALMERSLEMINEKFDATSIRISAQCYLKKFYEKFGFVIVSEEYLEDNIPHVEMLKIPVLLF